MSETGETQDIVFFHTAPVLVDVFQNLLGELAPGVVGRHVLRPDLLADAVTAGAATRRILQESANAMIAAAGPEQAMVVCTCSTIGAAADLADARSPGPVFRIDRPMARRSIELGRKILVMATLETTIAPTVELIGAEARRAGRTVEIDQIVLDHARRHFLEGRQEEYLDAVAAALVAAERNAEVVVLAQASMAAAVARADCLKTPIISSPRLGLEGALAVLRPDLVTTASRTATPGPGSATRRTWH